MGKKIILWDILSHNKEEDMIVQRIFLVHQDTVNIGISLFLHPFFLFKTPRRFEIYCKNSWIFINLVVNNFQQFTVTEYLLQPISGRNINFLILYLSISLNISL